MKHIDMTQFFGNEEEIEKVASALAHAGEIINVNRQVSLLSVAVDKEAGFSSFGKIVANKINNVGGTMSKIKPGRGLKSPGIKPLGGKPMGSSAFSQATIGEK